MTVSEVHELKDLVNDKTLISIFYDSLAAFIERNVSHEVLKAMAIHVMLTALQNQNCTILEASKYAADCCGFNSECIRRWASAYISTGSTCSVDELSGDECITNILSSNRGRHENHAVSLVNNEDFCLAA